ncbi:hypothetical protein KFL_000910080 [Klebsormidium nitens]|uniref:F-box domain-containing protein n=1 Tax=Klebsormidium nitens TaxID=105231 RepID=A0A1Y1I109_KLENI|nr:hypothetical protein KFL_000910080 [Klebsormidium nitens]|eukprot:GAQ81788.1 hypothetical protein KFL_000910080 [Klebsormidium nitens]
MALKRHAHSVIAGPSACRTEIGDLSSELLGIIFHKFGPSPVHLAALPRVCKAWRTVMQEVTYQQLCLEIAPGLCEKMGCDVTSQPPGGWLALFKLLLYCPGMQGLPTSYINWDGDYGSCLDLLGHVQEEACGFQTGPYVTRDLLLKKPFQRDCLFVTELCQHAWLDEDMRLAVCACRGLVQNFPVSAIARESGASKYAEASFEEQQLMRGTANDPCTFCGAPVFELREDVFFDIQESFRSWWQKLFDRCIPDWFDVTGQVCGNGHLTFEVFGNWDEASFLDGTPMAGSGKGLQVETCELLQRVCEELDPKEHDFCELTFWRDLNPYTLSQKLGRLANEIGMFVIDEEDEEGRELVCFLRHLHTISDFVEVIPKLERRMDDLKQMYEDSFQEDYEDSSEDSESSNEGDGANSADSESGSAADEEIKEEPPFWSVPFDDLEVVKSFQNESLALNAAQMVYTYLSNDKPNPSARMVVRTSKNMDHQLVLRTEAVRKLEEMKQERKAEIEAALTAAGVEKRGGEWPLPDAVQSYIKDPNVLLNEAVDRQRQCFLEAEEKKAAEQEKKAAERAQRERDTAMRRAEQETKAAERKAWRERKKAAERDFRAS